MVFGYVAGAFSIYSTAYTNINQILTFIAILNRPGIIYNYYRSYWENKSTET